MVNEPTLRGDKERTTSEAPVDTGIFLGEPFNVLEEPLDSSLTHYLALLVKERETTIHFDTGAGHIFYDLIAHWPIVQGHEQTAARLCSLITDLTYPLAARLYAQAVDITIHISSHPISPSFDDTDFSTYIALDSVHGIVRHVFIAPHHLPSAQDIAIPAGMSVLCRPLHYHYHQLLEDLNIEPRNATSNLPNSNNRNVDPESKVVPAIWDYSFPEDLPSAAEIAHLASTQRTHDQKTHDLISTVEKAAALFVTASLIHSHIEARAHKDTRDAQIKKQPITQETSQQPATTPIAHHDSRNQKTKLIPEMSVAFIHEAAFSETAPKTMAAHAAKHTIVPVPVALTHIPVASAAMSHIPLIVPHAVTLRVAATAAAATLTHYKDFHPHTAHTLPIVALPIMATVAHASFAPARHTVPTSVSSTLVRSAASTQPLNAVTLSNPPHTLPTTSSVPAKNPDATHQKTVAEVKPNTPTHQLEQKTVTANTTSTEATPSEKNTSVQKENGSSLRDESTSTEPKTESAPETKSAPKTDSTAQKPVAQADTATPAQLQQPEQKNVVAANTPTETTSRMQDVSTREAKAKYPQQTRASAEPTAPSRPADQTQSFASHEAAPTELRASLDKNYKTPTESVQGLGNTLSPQHETGQNIGKTPNIDSKPVAEAAHAIDTATQRVFALHANHGQHSTAEPVHWVVAPLARPTPPMITSKTPVPAPKPVDIHKVGSHAPIRFIHHFSMPTPR